VRFCTQQMLPLLALAGLLAGCEASNRFSAVSRAQRSAWAAGALADLLSIRDDRSMRISSAAPQRSSNWDNRRIPPGETLTIAEMEGPGVINHIWLTFPDPAPGWLGRDGNANHSELVLRIYWDGADEPAVESPVGDFFAAGFGRRAEVLSLPVLVQEGDAYNCFWPMPFHRSARLTIENQSRLPLNSLYYQVDYARVATLPPETPYFCAQYRQEFPAQSGRDYLILDAVGRGHYVGTVLSARSRSPEWFGEGDEKFYIDGETASSIQGTGTEDYALNAWGMAVGTYPYFGVPILEGEWGMVGWLTTIYRWHIPDPIRFTQSLRVEIENAGWISEDELAEGVHRGFVERNDDYATVAFWYQTGQPRRFTTLPAAAERVFPDLDLVIEGRDLLATARSENVNPLHLQKGHPWTGEGQLFINNTHGSGAWVEFDFDVQREELRQLTLRITRSYDFGRYRILLDGQVVRESVDFYSPIVTLTEINLGSKVWPVGRHTIRLECLGSNSSSTGTKLGVDSVRLRERWNVKRTAPSDE